MRPLTNQAESVAQAAGRDLLYELMLADIDHAYLDGPALDGFVDDPISGPPGCFHALSGPNRHPTD